MKFTVSLPIRNKPHIYTLYIFVTSTILMLEDIYIFFFLLFYFYDSGEYCAFFLII